MLFKDTCEMYNTAIKKLQYTDEKNIINHDLISSAFKKRADNMHKGSCGLLAVLAGSEGLTGAAVMSAEAALLGGCGLITLICQRELNPIYEIKLSEVMTLPVTSDGGVLSALSYPEMENKLKKSNALLFGPGMSCSPKVGGLLEKIIISSPKPMVIDADGINALSKNIDILNKASAPVILTPHIGEFSRLTGKDSDYILKNQAKLGEEFSLKYNVILVLKSHKTTVSFEGEPYKNLLGNPGMATGGSGDVLSGLIASLLAQGREPLLSALAGVYIHSLAADMASLEYGEYSLTPSNILQFIPYAIKHTTNNSR